MGQVARPYDLIRDLLGLDQRLRHAELLTGGRRWGPQEPWNYFGAAGQPALLSPWSGDGTFQHLPRWQRDERGIITFSGRMVKSLGHGGADAPMFYMPPGLEPAHHVRMPCTIMLAADSGTNSARGVVAMAAGSGPMILLWPWAATVDALRWLSLDGISYSIR